MTTTALRITLLVTLVSRCHQAVRQRARIGPIGSASTH